MLSFGTGDGGKAVAAVFSAEEILEIAEGRLAAGMMPDDAGEICVDTRTLREGQWFLALPGKHFDGHDFLGDAFSAGALGCIVEERANYAIASTSFPLLAVGDTEVAVSRLARNWRRRLNPRVALAIRSGNETKAIINHCRDCLSEKQQQDTVILLNAGWEEIMSELLALDETISTLMIEFVATSIDEVKFVADLVAPNVVLMPADALSQLRIQVSEDELSGAVATLVKSEQRGVVIISDRVHIDLKKQVAAEQLSRCIVYGQSGISAAESADEKTKELVLSAEKEFAWQQEVSDQATIAGLGALLAKVLARD